MSDEPRPDIAVFIPRLSSQEAVEHGGSKGFGSDALKVNGKIFAFYARSGRLVVKLPKARVDAIVEGGLADQFDPGHGRKMKEWAELAPHAADDALGLVQEALNYVAGGKK